MGALAGVVVSPGCRAVLGCPPDCVSLAPAACCPRPLLFLPSGFGRYSANKSEKIHSFLLFRFETYLTPGVITETEFLLARIVTDLFVTLSHIIILCSLRDIQGWI